MTQCVRNQTLGFAELPSKAKRVGAVTRCLARWGGLLARFVQSAAEQDALLTALTRHCDADEAARSVFEHVTKALYDCDEDLLGEEAIERWAAERQINPYWIWAIMREESSFNPTIESWANATGLMQIIIPTAKGLVRGTKIPPTKASLRQPEIAIRLGSKLLAQLIKEHPVIPLASTGYNAGSGATRSWRKRFGHLELDRLVEHIT